MRTKRLPIWIAALCLALTIPLSLRAETVSSVVAQDQVIDDNYVKFGDTITIDGTINGDALLTGDRIIVNGDIKGDLIALANSVMVNGIIGGSVRVASGDVTVRGSVAKNVTVAANNLEVTSNGQIGQSLAYAAGAVNMAGVVTGNVTGQSFSANIGGRVGRDVNITLSNGDLTVAPEANIKGNLRYGSNATATVDPARVSGSVIYHKTTDPVTGFKDILKVGTPLVTLFNFLALLLVGFATLALFPRGCRHVYDAMLTKPMVKIGWGIVIFVGLPILLAVLFITVIGIPLALIVIGLYLVFLYTAPIFVGLAIGQYLFKLILPARPLSPAIWLVVGLAIFIMATWLPLIGWLVSLLGTIWFLGGIVLRKIASMKESQAAVPKP